jgi:hypothetical protein
LNLKPNPNAGRKLGVPNKTTRETRELVKLAIENQTKHFDKTLNLIRDTDPIEWAKLMIKLYAFILPQKVDVNATQNMHIPIGAWLNVNTEVTENASSLDVSDNPTV